ncbi:MAG TPA: hypothetical protein VEU29_06225 [Actinomycetota bacterium]|nr:hypothetical protein [Actinomycetota bacterium]
MERRARALSLSLAAGLLMTLLVPAAASFAAAEPKIAFLNPSSFALAGERGYIVSDATTDVGPGCCAASDGVYRFSAWVTDAPVDSTVFFTVTQGALDFELPGFKPAGDPPEADTWEASWDIPPEVLNGPATVTAYVVLDNEPVARKSVDVTIMRIEPAIDLAYPTSGGPFGTFAPLASSLPEKGGATRKKPVATIDALYTATPDMSFVRTFYTTSPAGTEPQWKVCGTEVIGPNNNNADNGVRCTLADPADAQAITAVAAVANDSPNGYEDRFNESGDVVRVTPYVQQPAQVDLGEVAEQRVDKDAASDRFFCSGTITATVTDQLGRVVPGANVDAEAVGPADSLRFHTSAVLGGPVAPDRGNHTVEPAFDCTGRPEVPPANASPGEQGEHQVFGSPDPKHVEVASGGTGDRGTFGIRLYSSAPGVTQYTVWADEVDDGCAANDDRLTIGEPAAAGSIGWAATPETTGFRTPLAVVPCTPDGGPSPDPTETPGGPAARTVGIGASDRSVPAGTSVRLSGRVRSDTAGCVGAQHLTLQARRPGRRFRAVATALTRDSGRYRLKVVVSRTREYRAVLGASETCAGARSRTITVRATRT